MHATLLACVFLVVVYTRWSQHMHSARSCPTVVAKGFKTCTLVVAGTRNMHPWNHSSLVTGTITDTCNKPSTTQAELKTV